MQILETGLLDACGITRVGVAGHPEGSPDIPADDVWQAVADKNAFSERSDAALYIATQVLFRRGRDPALGSETARRRQHTSGAYRGRRPGQA